MKKFISCVVAVMATVAMAETASMVTVTKFNQSYPYTGKATVEYTVGGTLPAGAVAEITVTADGTSATFTQSDIVAGANAFTIDFASSFGGAPLLTNASFKVTIVADFGGVQLWKDGPYWAECNVGAENPEDDGYYFWWGDTVGYTNTGSAWISVKDGTSISFSGSGTAASTNKDKSALQSEGWIDATGNLTAAHDAATAHLGAPWRMPTSGECLTLIDDDYCTASRVGMSGMTIRGKGEYSNRSIFIPFASVGIGNRLDRVHDDGVHSYNYYWSSTLAQGSGSYSWALALCLLTGAVDADLQDRYIGLPVRPVRGSPGAVSASGIITCDPAVFVIESVDDWNRLSAAVADGIRLADGLNVRLANDVGPVSTMVGTAEHPFTGFFDGGSNTLTLALSGTDDYVAPFSRVSGATIRDLKVAGTVSGKMHCSALVGSADGATNRIEGCEVAAAISSSGTHFGGFVGHGQTSATALLGCVFSGSFPTLSSANGDIVGTFNGWSDPGAATTLIDCFDVSEFHAPIGLGANAVCVSNTYWRISRIYPPAWDQWWSNDKSGKMARSVTADEGVELGFGEPLCTYGASGLTAYPVGVAYGGTFYAGSRESVTLSPAFTGTPPVGMKHDAFAASAGELAKSGDNWILTMPAADNLIPTMPLAAVVISATFADATAYEIWAAANGVSGAWDETDALGIHNVFRYAFDKPSGAFENPALLDIAIEGVNAVVKTPPVANTAGFTISVVESGDVAGETVTDTKPLDATGRVEFPMGSAPARFYRLSATEGNP